MTRDPFFTLSFRLARRESREEGPVKKIPISVRDANVQEMQRRILTQEEVGTVLSFCFFFVLPVLLSRGEK